MDYCVIAHINRKSISFYYQKRNTEVEKLEYNGKNTHPLYFYVHDNSFSFGDYALEQYEKGDDNAYGNYFELIKEADRFYFFNKKRHVRLLLIQLVEDVLGSFFKNELSYTDDVSDYRSDIPLRFIFESDIKPDERTSLLTEPFSSIGYRNVEEIFLIDFIKKTLINKSLSKNDNLLLVESINGGLHLNYLSKDRKDIDYTGFADNLGIDPKISITSEILYKYAITKLRLRLDREKELQHLSKYAKEFLAQSSYMPQGMIELSNGNRLHAKVRKKEVNSKVIHSGFDVKLFGFIDDFFKKNNIESKDTRLVLLGQDINTDYFIENLSNKYKDIISVTPKVWNLAFNEAVLEIQNNNYQRLRKPKTPTDDLKEKADQLLKKIEDKYKSYKTIKELERGFNDSKDVKDLNSIIIKLTSLSENNVSDDVRLKLDILYENRKNVIEQQDTGTLKKKADFLLKEIKTLFFECKTPEELQNCDKTHQTIKEFNNILDSLTALGDAKASSSLQGQKSILKTSAKQKIIGTLEGKVNSLLKAIKIGYSKCKTKTEIEEYDIFGSEVVEFNNILNILRAENTRLNISSLEQQKALLKEIHTPPAPKKETVQKIKERTKPSSKIVDTSSHSKWDALLENDELVKTKVKSNNKGTNKKTLPSIRADYNKLESKGKYSSTDPYIEMYLGHNRNEARFIYLLKRNKVGDAKAKKRFARLHQLYEDYFGLKLEVKDFSEGRAFSKPNFEGETLPEFISKYKFNKPKASLMGSRKKHFQVKEKFYEVFEETFDKELGDTIRAAINPKEGHSIIVKSLGKDKYKFHFTNFNLDEITNKDRAIKHVNDSIINMFYKLMGDDFMTEMGF